MVNFYPGVGDYFSGVVCRGIFIPITAQLAVRPPNKLIYFYRLLYIVECFCNFSAIGNGCNNEPVTKQVQLDETYQPPARGVSDRSSCCPIRVSSRNNNTNVDNKTEVKVETARKDSASTGRHSSSRRQSRSSRSSTPRNNASVMSPDSAEQQISNQDTLRPRGCPCPRVVDLISSDSLATAVGGNQNYNNRGSNETQ